MCKIYNVVLVCRFMINDSKEFYLDFQKDKLLVWEWTKSLLVVDAMYEGIELGHLFPAVDVVRDGNGIFEIMYGYGENQNIWEYGG